MAHKAPPGRPPTSPARPEPPRARPPTPRAYRARTCPEPPRARRPRGPVVGDVGDFSNEPYLKELLPAADLLFTWERSGKNPDEVDMSVQLAPRLVRSLAWADAELVEGTEALLWPATGTEDADTELPDRSEAFRAVVSWVRPQIIRFETATPQPLPELLLVSTVAVGGPAQFVVRKTYQIGTTGACEPPKVIHIVERRDLFRVPVAAPVTVQADGTSWSLFTLDCSVGGLRICPPVALVVGTELEVKLELHEGYVLDLPAVVRHSHPYLPVRGRLKPGQPVPGTTEESPSVVGLQFLRVPSEAERRLSEFVGRHQRRLMPRVNARISMEYCPAGRTYYLEALASEVSPGDVVFEGRKAHLPGERMNVRMRLGRQEFEHSACVVACHTTEKEDGSLMHQVKAALDESTDAGEALFRRAVRELALEKMAFAR